jgi:hypothetical protein
VSQELAEQIGLVSGRLVALRVAPETPLAIDFDLIARRIARVGVIWSFCELGRKIVSKRAQRIKRRSQRDVIMPTAERLAQGLVERIEEMIADDEGRPGLPPWRALDTLSRMERQGTINGPMRQAGDRFHDTFRVAGLEALHAADPTRIPVQLNSSRVIRLHAGGSEGARRAVIKALDALGGIMSPGGSCAFHVLGLEETLERWAATRGWADRRITRDMAAGILVCSLGNLKRYYRL